VIAPDPFGTTAGNPAVVAPINILAGTFMDPDPATAPPPPKIGEDLDDFLANVQPIHWTVDGLAIDGGIVVFAGRPESFKSTAAHNIGMSYAGVRPSPWMGLDVAGGPVVYVTNEKARASIGARLGAMRSAGKAPAHPFIVILNKVRISAATAPDQHPWSDVISLIGRLHADTGKRVLLIVDTLTSCAPVGFDENSGESVMQVLTLLKQARDAGATIILVHHFSKAGHANGSDSMGIRGHTALYGDVDGTVIFERPDEMKPNGVMRPRPKDGVATKRPFVVTTEGDFWMGPAIEVMGASLTNDLITGIVGTWGPMSQNDIVAKVQAENPSLSRDAIRTKVKTMLDSGMLTKTKGRNPLFAVPNDDDGGGSGGRQADADAEVGGEDNDA
jgi:hypothetical protein